MHLNRTKTSFELKMARKKRRDEIDFAETERGLLSTKVPTKKKLVKPLDSNLNILIKMLPGVTGNNRNGQIKDDLDLSSNDGSLLNSSSQRLKELSELVKKDSKDLPDIRGAQARALKARRRKRSVSDGVAAMRLFSTTSTLAAEALKDENDMDSEQTLKTSTLQDVQVPGPASLKASSLRGATRTRPRRQKAVSTGVFLMQSEKSDPLPMGLGKEPSQEKPRFQESDNIFQTKPSKLSGTDDMPKSLQLKKFNMPISEEDSGDEPSEKNINEQSDDEISDGVPDIEDFSESVVKIDISQRLREMYMSKSYRQTSAVFGTMLVFFMIASRIELILLDICYISGETSSIYM